MGCLRVVIGPILILAALYALLFWYGYSTMIDPSLPALHGGRSGSGGHSPAVL